MPGPENNTAASLATLLFHLSASTSFCLAVIQGKKMRGKKIRGNDRAGSLSVRATVMLAVNRLHCEELAPSWFPTLAIGFGEPLLSLGVVGDLQ